MKKISFEDYREEMPSWLADYSVGTVVDVDVIFKGNTLYWSEADAVDSGAPIRLLNVAHAAHLFVYASCRYCDGRHGGVDFRGYTLLDEQALDLERLLADTSEDYRPVVDGAWPKEAVLRIYERLPEFGEEHGALRFAFLELAGDSIDLYDRLFGGWTNGRSAPLLVGVGDYNGKTPFGKEYRDRCVLKGGRTEWDDGWETSFESRMWTIGMFPRIMFAMGPRTQPWTGYVQVDVEKEVSEGFGSGRFYVQGI